MRTSYGLLSKRSKSSWSDHQGLGGVYVEIVRCDDRWLWDMTFDTFSWRSNWYSAIQVWLMWKITASWNSTAIGTKSRSRVHWVGSRKFNGMWLNRGKTNDCVFCILFRANPEIATRPPPSSQRSSVHDPRPIPPATDRRQECVYIFGWNVHARTQLNRNHTLQQLFPFNCFRWNRHYWPGRKHSMFGPT